MRTEFLGIREGTMRGRLLGVLCLGLIIASQVRADNAGVFTYQNGSFTTISNSAFDTPLGIDNAGDLLLATDGNIGGPVLFSGGNLTPISLSGATTEAFSMSQNGTIFGSYITDTRHYFTDLNGSITTFDLPGLPRTTGNALNNDEGQIIASNFNCCNQPDFIYNVNTASASAVSFPGATDTSLIAINNKGQALGVASGGSSGLIYFVYSAGIFSALTLPTGCSPDGINSSDAIVGNCFSGNVLRGFIDKSGTLTYISYNGNSNVNSTLISDINDSGEIVGTFQNVPETSTLSHLGIGLLLVAVICTVGGSRRFF